MKSAMMDVMKRKLLSTLWMALPLIGSCHAAGAVSDGAQDTDQQRRFKGMGLVLVTDAVAGSEMLGVEFFADGRELPFYAKSVLARRTREIMAFPSGRVPLKVRVTWRKVHDAYDGPGGIRYRGEIAGDYTIDAATRIPDAFLDEIRANGGNLRLKFRLKPDGVLFGWDIQRKAKLGNVSVFEMPGGDFLETKY
jgi:hypothetical protein